MGSRSRLVSIAVLLPFVTITILIIQLSVPQSVYVTGQTLDTTKTSTSSYYYYNNNTISTRGHFDYLKTGELVPEHDSTDYWYYNDISGNTSGSIQNEIMCPSQKEIAIYIHGVWTDETSANEQVNRTAMSLQTNNYT